MLTIHPLVAQFNEHWNAFHTQFNSQELLCLLSNILIHYYYDNHAILQEIIKSIERIANVALPTNEIMALIQICESDSYLAQ